MPALANRIDSLIANAEGRTSIDGQKTIWKLTAVNSVVGLINGVYFLIWTYLTDYNGVHFVQYEGFRYRPGKPVVIERNGLFYHEDEDITYYFDRSLLARWYGIAVSPSHSLWLATHERILRKLVYYERDKENTTECNECRFDLVTVFLFFFFCLQVFVLSVMSVFWVISWRCTRVRKKRFHT